MDSHGNMTIFASGSDNITDKYHNFNLWLETASLYIALLWGAQQEKCEGILVDCFHSKGKFFSNCRTLLILRLLLHSVQSFTGHLLLIRNTKFL